MRAQHVLIGIGKFSERKTKVKGKTYVQYVIYVPKLVALDSRFPFKPGERVVIRIDVDRQRLLIEKAE